MSFSLESTLRIKEINKNRHLLMYTHINLNYNQTATVFYRVCAYGLEEGVHSGSTCCSGNTDMCALKHIETNTKSTIKLRVDIFTQFSKTYGAYFVFFSIDCNWCYQINAWSPILMAESILQYCYLYDYKKKITG